MRAYMVRVGRDPGPARTAGKLEGDARTQTLILCRGPRSRLGGEGRRPLGQMFGAGAGAVASCELGVGSKRGITDLLAIASCASSEEAILRGQTTDPSFSVRLNQILFLQPF